MHLINHCIIVLVLFELCSSVISQNDNELMTKLQCNPAETRLFNYESDTKLWGPLEETFSISAQVKVHCMGNDNTGKYGNDALKYMVEITKLEPRVLGEKKNDGANVRGKRDVGNWFRNAWESVKSFFRDLFTKGKAGGDANDFDTQPSNRQYTCGTNKNDRRKRDAESNNGKIFSQIYDKVYETPFEFLQLEDGTVPEVRFSDKDKDVSVKNFKRHIADAFATQLNSKKRQILEESPIGSHLSKYTFDETGKMAEHEQKTFDGSTFKLGGVGLSLLASGYSKPIAIVRDVSQDAMTQFSNGIIHDPSQININAKQIQQISDGRLTNTAGHLSLSLINPHNGKRPKRNVHDNSISDYMKIQTKYSLSMTKKITKREANDGDNLKKLKHLESELNFHGETLVSQTSPENSLKDKLMIYRETLSDLLSSNNGINQIFYFSNNDNPIYNTLINAMETETLLNIHESNTSITYAVRNSVTEDKLKEQCYDNSLINHRKCKHILLILIKAQSPIVLKELLKVLDVKDNIEEKKEVLKMMIHINKPYDWFIQELMSRVKGKDTNYNGLLFITLSNLAYRSSSDSIKNNVAQMLINKLAESNCDDNDHLSIDVMESLGNLGNTISISPLMQIEDKCLHSEAYQISAVHGIRKLISNHNVQNWLNKLLKDSKRSCTVKKEIVNILIENINQMEISYNPSIVWPKKGFNGLDDQLAEMVIKKGKDHECLQNVVARYFTKKNDDRAKTLLTKIMQIRSKRSVNTDNFWNDAYCREYTGNAGNSDNKKETNNNDGDGVVIIGSERNGKIRETEIDSNVAYRKRQKCSATKSFGPKQARAVFTADIINDLSGSEQNPEYKLLAQFSVGTHFLGTDVDIGKMYIYNRKNSTRAYVNIFGNTLVDAVQNNCENRPIEPYTYTSFLPLYDFNVWIVQMTLGVRLTGDMSFELPKMNCDEFKGERSELNNHVELTPEARVRAAGEVSGKVLMVRGGLNIGGDFNSFANLKFVPDPQYCLSAYNGNKPMNVSIMSWYQFWHPTCSEWMQRSVWTPQSLNWQINNHRVTPWIENECLIKDSKKDNKIDP